jgi:3-oxoacyl-[acyl-carrier protein] reductase
MASSTAAHGSRLAGRTAIITGAGSGIGRASVERFLAEGANVVAADINGDAAEAVVGAANAGDRAVATATDVTRAAAVQQAVDVALERFGSLDIYYNNAGVPQIAALVEDVDDETWRRVLDVNLTAIFIAARIVVPIMKQQRSGVILVTASMSGIRPRPQLSAYTAAKGGAVNLAKALAIELAEYGIRVNSVNPVSTNTPMLSQFGSGDHTTANATPLGRLGQAEEMAAAAAFLASDDASFITGSALQVDGGRGI